MSDNPFNIVGSDQVAPQQKGEAISEADKSLPLNERIEKLIGSSDIFLFMKGMPEMPMCGFSANVVAILNSFGASFKTFNILEDMDIRQGVKDFSNWPTYPQLYVKGKLLGGNDVITELYEDGELKEALNI